MMDSNENIFDVSYLNLQGDFDEQVSEILQFVRLTRQEVERLQLLFDDLQCALEFKWRGCEVKAFGSIVTGLGIKTSDVDCYISLPSWLSPPQATFVQQARNILRQQSNIFQNVFAIVGAKVPIVKFYHVPTRRNCDVSFKSPAGVENSRLLSCLMQMDRRVLPLTILIKYWSKVHNLTGTNLMPNYCLTLLVIFYLQQRNILPPVRLLQRHAYEIMIDEWNVGFESIYHRTDNNESLYELLRGFFKYYCTFDYGKFVICTYLGHIVDRELFKSVETVPDDFALYHSNIRSKICKPIRLDVFMCVQDPFEHNRNCAVAVHPKLAQNVLSHIIKAARFFDGDSRSVLKKLLTNTQSVNVKPKHKQPRLPVPPRGIGKNYKQIQKRFGQNLKKLGNKMTNDKLMRDWL